MCSRQEPTNAANEALISLLSTYLHGRVIRIGGGHNGINWNTRTIRCCRGCLMLGLASKTLDKVSSKTRLIEMDSHQGRRDLPQEVNAKEPLNNPHKINFALLGEEVTE